MSSNDYYHGDEHLLVCFCNQCIDDVLCYDEAEKERLRYEELEFSGE